MAAQLRVLLADPLRFLTIPANSLLHQGYVFREMVGVLGWLNLLVPQPLAVLWVVALGTAFLGPAVLRRTRPDRHAVASGLVVMLGITGSVELIYLSQYLSFTEVGARLAEGVQGRYFLPLLPLLAIVFCRREERLLSPPSILAIGTLVAASLGTLFWLPFALFRFYYLG